MSALDLLMEGVKTVAPMVANMVLPGIGGPIAHKIIRQVTGDFDSPIEQVAEQVQANPAQRAEFMRIAADREVKLAQITKDEKVDLEKERSAQMESVNATMRVEAAGGGWMSKNWRGLWGVISAVAFGICCIGLVWLIGKAISASQTEFINSLPALVMAITTLFSIPGAICGVTSWHRGKTQRVAAGEISVEKPPGGLVGAIKAWKGN